MSTQPAEATDRLQPVAAGVMAALLAAVSTALVGVVAAAPVGLVGVVAGIALLGTLGGALQGATRTETGREAAVVTFVMAASGVAFGGIGAAFWALVAGPVRSVLRTREAAA